MLPVYSGFFLRFSSQPIALAPTFTVDFQVFLPHLMSGDRKMEALGSLVNSCEQASSLFKHQRSPGSTKHLVLQRLFKHLVLQPFFGRPWLVRSQTCEKVFLDGTNEKGQVETAGMSWKPLVCSCKPLKLGASLLIGFHVFLARLLVQIPHKVQQKCCSKHIC